MNSSPLKQVLPALALAVAYAAAPAAPPRTPPDVTEVSIRSTRDAVVQRALMYVPGPAAAGEEKRGVPLLVFLHSWSGNYKGSDSVGEAVEECRRRGWAFVSPDFRGPNNRPEACASDLAVQDVLDSVAFVRKQAHIDARRIYLLGGSGGGHMALTMASRAPRLWAAVSAWVPISDLAAFHAHSKAGGTRYYRMVEQCCGGAPGTPGTEGEYRRRSPLHHLARARSLRVDIEAGIRDGHEGSVPISHSLLAFNELARANGLPERMLSQAEIDEFTRTAHVPDGLKSEPASEAGRKHKVLFRRTAGPVRLSIFDGGHAIDAPTGIRWLASCGEAGR